MGSVMKMRPGESVNREDWFRRYARNTLAGMPHRNQKPHLIAYGASLLGSRAAAARIVEEEIDRKDRW